VREGCNLWLLLLNIYIEQAIIECTGIKVNGMGMQMVRFADDVTIIAQDEINLKRALECLDDILNSKYKMKMNRTKTEVMVCSKNHENFNVKMDDNTLKQVPTFKYLGSILTEDGKNKEDIIKQIKEAKVMFNNNSIYFVQIISVLK
jgi:hypothetical protein